MLIAKELYSQEYLNVLQVLHLSLSLSYYFIYFIY